MSAVRTRLNWELATILAEVLNNRARQLEQHAEVLACAARAKATHGRVGEADQLSRAARKHRVTSIKLRALATATHHREWR
jgi:hypothetical protein